MEHNRYTRIIEVRSTVALEAKEKGRKETILEDRIEFTVEFRGRRVL